MITRTHLRLALAALFIVVASLTAQAQIKPETTAPKEGFWVVETAYKSRQCTVRFYTNERKLIYEETVNRALNITRRHTKRQLAIALDQAMFVWNATRQVPTDRQWVAVRFEKK